MRSVIAAIGILLFFAGDAMAGATKNVGQESWQLFSQRIEDTSHTDGFSTGLCGTQATLNDDSSVKGYCVIPAGKTYTITTVQVYSEATDAAGTGECRAILETVVLGGDTPTPITESGINYGNDNGNGTSLCVDGESDGTVNQRGESCTVNLATPVTVAHGSSFGVSIIAGTGDGGTLDCDGGTCECGLVDSDTGEIMYSVYGYWN